MDSILKNVNSLGILLNFKELVKVEDDSRDVAEEEDADDAYQDRGKVHLFKRFGLRDPGKRHREKGKFVN